MSMLGRDPVTLATADVSGNLPANLRRTVTFDNGKEFAEHETVCHSAEEYVRGDVHTNTVEGFFAILKRGLIGTFHSVSKKPFHPSCCNFIC